MSFKPDSLGQVEEYVAGQFKVRRIAGDPKALALKAWNKGEERKWVMQASTWGSWVDGFINTHVKNAKSGTARTVSGSGNIYVCGLCWTPRYLPPHIKEGPVCVCMSLPRSDEAGKVLTRAIHYYRMDVSSGCGIDALLQDIGRLRARMEGTEEYKERTSEWFALVSSKEVTA